MVKVEHAGQYKLVEDSGRAGFIDIAKLELDYKLALLPNVLLRYGAKFY